MASPGRNRPSAKAVRHSRNGKDAWTRPLWPAHLKPLPDELLSSWLVRLAAAHGLKVQTFSRLLAGSGYHIWNRDIDRTAPEWLLDAVCSNTATPTSVANSTTLKAYEGEIYRVFHDSYVLPWILPLKIQRFTRTGYGLQFCPMCLAEDGEPYFRKRWRVALYTWCSAHNVMLHDRCPHCGAPVIFQRRELGRPNESDQGAITQCYACDFDLRETPTVTPIFYEESSRQGFRLSAQQFENCGQPSYGQQYYAVLHHLCRMMHSMYRDNWPLEFACQSIGVAAPRLVPKPRTFEGRSLSERHQLVQLGFWYVADLENRLTAAWHEGAITYSALFKDFEDRPDYYDRILERFSNWRSRSMSYVQPRGGDGRFRRQRTSSIRNVIAVPPLKRGT